MPSPSAGRDLVQEPCMAACRWLHASGTMLKQKQLHLFNEPDWMMCNLVNDRIVRALGKKFAMLDGQIVENSASLKHTHIARLMIHCHTQASDESLTSMSI